jgi:hypothetical protein
MKLISLTKYIFGIVLLLTSSLPTQAKVLIFTFSYNKPEFIELQYKTFKKFLLDDHELVVFNDATESEMATKINNMCEKYAIQCIPVPQEIHDRPYLDRSTEIKHWFINEYHAPSVLYSNVAQYALDAFGFQHDDILVIFEADLFLIKEFSFHEYLKNYALAGYNRQTDYQGDMGETALLWIGLIPIDMKSLPNKTMLNLNCGTCYNVTVDCGGHTNFYIKNNPTVQIKYFDKIRIRSYYCNTCEGEKSYLCTHNTPQLKNLGFDDKTIAFIQQVPIDWGSGVMRPNGVEGNDKRNIEFFVNRSFLHFNGAAGYANSSYIHNFDIVQFYKDKTEAILKYINDILEH